MRAFFRSGASCYLIAVAATAAAFVARLLLDRWLGGAAPLLTFALAVMATAACGGLRPGLFATALSALAGAFFLARTPSTDSSREAAQFVLFAVVGCGISLLCERLLDARRAAERESAERRRSETALQTQKELLQTTLTSAGDGMIATDAEGRVTFLNPVAERLTGWAQAEAAGVPLTAVFAIVNEETRATVENPALRALAEGRIVGLANHTVLISKDGSERPIDDSAAPIRAADGTIHGSILVFRDIGDRKRAEQALRESERRYRTALESITDAFVAVDRDWRFTYVNREAERLTGRPREELLGEDHWEVYADTLGTEVERSLRRAAEENVTVSFETYYAPQGRWYETRAYPSADGLSIYFRDVTDDRRADEERRFLAAVVESSTDLVGLASLDGRVRFFNEAGLAMLGLRDNEEARATTLFDYIFPEDMPFAEREMLPRLAAEGRWEGEWRYRRRDGSEVPISKKVTVIRDPSTGEPAAYATVSRDISDRKRAEEDLRRSEEHLRAIVEATPECVKLVSADGSLLHMNAAGLAMIEADDLEGVAGACVYDLVVPEHRQAWVAFNKRVCGGARETFEFDIVGLKGTRRHMETTAVPVRMPDDSTAHLAVTRDVTERRRAEERLRLSEERFRFVRKTSGVGFWYCDLPFDVLEWDDQVKAHFHLPSDAAVTIDIFYDRIHPDDRERTRRAIERSVTDRAVYDVDYRTVDPVTGKEHWVRAIGRTFYGADGSPRRFDGVTLDVTDRKRKEEELADARRRLEAALEAGEIGTWIWDIAEDRVHADRNLARMFAVSDDEAAGGRLATYTRSIHPEDTGQVAAAIGAAVESGRRFEEEYRIVRPDGSVRWVIARGGVEQDGAGRPVRMAGLVVDITHRHRAEQLLGDQKRILERMVQGADLSDLLETLCEAAERQSAAGAVATVLMADPGRGGLVPAAGRRCPQGYSQALGVVPIGPAVGSCGTAAYRGEPVIVEDIATDPLWVDFRDVALTHGLRACWSLPVRSSAGSVLGTVAVYNVAPCRPNDHDLRVLDVLARTAGIAIERRRAEEAAGRRSEQLRRLAEVAARLNVAHDTASVVGVTTEEVRNLIGAHQAVATMTADRDGSQAINAVSLSDKYAGYRGHQVPPVGAGIFSLVCETNMPMRLTQAELEAHPAWRNCNGDTRHPPKRGWLAAPLVGRDGRNIGLIQLSDKEEGEFTEDDESILVQLAQLASVAIENARLYESLKEADRRKDEFLATLAHELRNPLAPIRMGLEVLRLGGDDPELTNETYATMEGQVRQMVRLIDDLLDVSRITRGKLELRKTRVELKDVVKTAADTARPMIEEARHELTVSLPNEPLALDGDPARLSQVIANLLNNAAKYTPEGGKISLSAERQGSDVVVSVKDTGLGIPPEMFEKVFEMFTQVDRTLERSHGGLGIGLHLVKRLVEMHGGSVEARSEGEGRGSEFLVRLPLVIAPARPIEEAAADETGLVGRRVLVADDNKDAADLLARVLRALGHDVRVAYDGEQAFAAAESFRPEVCLLDIGMPRRNGYEVARDLRAEPWGEGMLLVALTGWGAEEDRRRSREVGFDRHLVKPVEPSELKGLLADLRRTMA